MGVEVRLLVIDIQPQGEDRYQLRLSEVPPNPHDGRLEPGRSLKIVTLLLPSNVEQKEQVANWFV